MTEKIVVTKHQFENPCEGCTHMTCCLELVFDGPFWREDPSQVDVDILLWYLTRENISVIHKFKDGKPTLHPEHWEINLKQRCKYLTTDNKCSIYNDPNRPRICHWFAAFPLKAPEDEDAFCDRYSGDVSYGDFTFTDISTFRQKMKEWFDLDPWLLPKEPHDYDMTKIEIPNSH